MAALDGPKHKSEVEAIINTLERGDESTETAKVERLLLLKQLHASTRMLPDGELQPLFSRRGVRLLGQCGFDYEAKIDHLFALRCLNNVLVRSPSSRQVLAHEIDADKIIATILRQDPDDQLPLSNILIFLSHGTSLDLTKYLEKDGVADAINSIIAHHANSGALPTNEPTSACSASLRLLSTLAARYEDLSHLFFDSIDPVMEMLSKINVPIPPLDTSVSLLVNCLPVLPVQKKETFPSAAIDKLVEVLKDCLNYYGTQDKAGEFLPLLLGLHRIAQSEAAEAKTRLQASIIPTVEDRQQVLGQGTTLPHMLLRLANHSMFSEVRELIMAIFFDLSDKDPSRFVHNVGFGNAAGYLSSKGIELSQKDLGVDDLGPDVNPITGQRVDAEPETVMPDMTDEEKEREAERLFVLFERLRATGVVDVENPVAAAARSGRIQELSDSSDDEK